MKGIYELIFLYIHLMISFASRNLLLNCICTSYRIVNYHFFIQLYQMKTNSYLLHLLYIDHSSQVIFPIKKLFSFLWKSKYFRTDGYKSVIMTCIRSFVLFLSSSIFLTEIGWILYIRRAWKPCDNHIYIRVVYRRFCRYPISSLAERNIVKLEIVSTDQLVSTLADLVRITLLKEV